MFLMLMGAGSLLACRPSAREYTVHGPEGGIALKVTLPDGFDTATGHCSVVADLQSDTYYYQDL